MISYAALWFEAFEAFEAIDMLMIPSLYELYSNVGTPGVNLAIESASKPCFKMNYDGPICLATMCETFHQLQRNESARCKIWRP